MNYRTGLTIIFLLPPELVRGVPQVVLDFKGLAYFELEVKTLTTDAHSFAAPVVENPVWRLIRALHDVRVRSWWWMPRVCQP